MMRSILSILTILLLSSCSSEEPTEDVAQKQREEYTKELELQKVSDNNTEGLIRDFSVAPDDMVIGNPESKVVLVEYFSPTCPHCVSYHKRIFPEIKVKYIDTNKIAYVFREFIGTKQDFDAAILARCRGDVSTYLKFLEVILIKQDGWAFDKNYREILTNLGSLGSIPPEEFAKCLNDQDKIKILLDNTKLITNTPGFVGTPSFFINGKQFNGRYNAEELSKALDKCLEEVNVQENTDNSVTSST